LGVDVARGRLGACQERFPRMAGRLAWAEAERLPFADETFDAVFSIGGFNYFSDHRLALREMRRVGRAGARLIVADELPNLHHLAPGRVLGFEGFDRWCLAHMGLDRDFLEMVFGHRPNIDDALRAGWPTPRRSRIWNRLGYCMVDRKV